MQQDNIIKLLLINIQCVVQFLSEIVDAMHHKLNRRKTDDLRRRPRPGKMGALSEAGLAAGYIS